MLESCTAHSPHYEKDNRLKTTINKQQQQSIVKEGKREREKKRKKSGREGERRKWRKGKGKER